MGLGAYFKESYRELTTEVSWPTWSEAQRLTVVVAVFSIIFSIFIWAVDQVFSGAIAAYFDWVK